MRVLKLSVSACASVRVRVCVCVCVCVCVYDCVFLSSFVLGTIGNEEGTLVYVQETVCTDESASGRCPPPALPSTADRQSGLAGGRLSYIDSAVVCGVRLGWGSHCLWLAS